MTEWLIQTAECEAKLDVAQVRLGKLELLYREIKQLTLQHDVIISNDIEHASVSPRKLADALSKVDSVWYHDVK